MIRKLASAALAAGLLAAAPSARAGDDEALTHASERGRLLYAYDQAAWVSSDEMLRVIAKPDKAGVRGYVVEPLADGTLRAIYYGFDGATPKAVFTADVRGSKVVARHRFAAGEDAALSPTAVALIRARDAATAEAERKRLGACAKAAFNTVALPAQRADAPVPVYLLTPQVAQNQFPFGGHYEIDVAADGAIAAQRGFTKSCLTMSPGGGSGGAPAGVMVSHLLDATPTEIHVFQSLSMRLPVYVVTGEDKLWLVDGDKITAVDPKSGG
ncbi:hypothetical protein [Caulobacter sp. 17J65-9]|uniref:hypothetical protein n=1 Tax=Caulobacter sp. 17J65-9 TaxID=2709382 RepID=UPI0013C885D5|nr:hypothetical protein [Caulobacter sp. 17J65-9]NEX94918.1 hypothetical protein [Caulobacter sp. 17J65-9]